MQSENLETFLRNRNVEGYDFENQYPEIWLESTLCDWKKNYSVLWILNGLRDSLIQLRNYFSNVNFVKMLDSTVWSSELDTLLMRYEVNLTP